MRLDYPATYLLHDVQVDVFVLVLRPHLSEVHNRGRVRSHSSSCVSVPGRVPWQLGCRVRAFHLVNEG